jgi:amidophosphoribosyltransferase
MLEGSKSFFNRHLKTSSDSEVLLNIFADEIHRAHQNFLNVGGPEGGRGGMRGFFGGG